MNPSLLHIKQTQNNNPALLFKYVLNFAGKSYNKAK